jgi:hypothetical protein
MPLVGTNKRTVERKTYIVDDGLNTMKLGRTSYRQYSGVFGKGQCTIILVSVECYIQGGRVDLHSVGYVGS